MGTEVGGKAEQAGDSAVLAGLARVGLIAYGVVHLLIGWLALQIAWGGKEIDTSSMSPTARKGWPCWVGSGTSPGGLALGVVGGLLGYAALTFDPQQARGLDGAMRTILEQPFGQFLLIAVALGFIAFGLFAFLQSRYRRM